MPSFPVRRTAGQSAIADPLEEPPFPHADGPTVRFSTHSEDRMPTEAEFHQEMLSLHRRTGIATGYWPGYFLRSVRQGGGLAVAKPTSKGFEKLEEVKRMDLSIEYLVIEGHYAHLFTPEELDIARQRLARIPRSSFPEDSAGPRTLGEVDDGATYEEGATLHVLVNRYERDPKARAKCIEHHGTRCAICKLDFETRYGEIGQGFIHVHHLRPLGRLESSYRLDPVKDLVPVCPELPRHAPSS